MSDLKKATLITCRHMSNARILKSIEGSGHKYLTSQEETAQNVIIRQASIALLQEELRQLGLIIQDIPTIQRVAEKFTKELITKAAGHLAVDNDFGLGLCEIVNFNITKDE